MLSYLILTMLISKYTSIIYQRTSSLNTWVIEAVVEDDIILGPTDP